MCVVWQFSDRSNDIVERQPKRKVEREREKDKNKGREEEKERKRSYTWYLPQNGGSTTTLFERWQNRGHEGER